MQGFAHALLQNFGDSLPEEAKDYAQRIIASGRQSEVLIRDLLAYSRLSFEELEVQAVSLAKVVATAREQLDGVLDEAKVDLSVEGGLPAVLGQTTTLVQVVTNLISTTRSSSSQKGSVPTSAFGLRKENAGCASQCRTTGSEFLPVKKSGSSACSSA